MHLATRQVGDVSVIDVTSKNMGGSAPSIREAVARLHNDGRTLIVLNLAGLEYVDSAGLGDLVTCNIRSAQSGRPLKVAAITPRIDHLLKTTRLATTFDRYETVEAAIASYHSATPESTAGGSA